MVRVGWGIKGACECEGNDLKIFLLFGAGIDVCICHVLCGGMM